MMTDVKTDWEQELQAEYSADGTASSARWLRGRPPKRPVPNRERRTVEHVLSGLPRSHWRTVTWRRGTRGALCARFSVVRVRVADGAELALGQHLPGKE